MSFNSNINTSIHGRRFGLQRLSTTETGGSRGAQDFLVGPEGLRAGVSTAESTGTNLHPFGVSRLTTAVSSGVYTIDPPIPGVSKTLVFDTTGTNPIYVKTANNEYVTSTQMTTATVIASSQTANVAVTLVGVSTSQWWVLNSVSSGLLKLSTST